MSVLNKAFGDTKGRAFGLALMASTAAVALSTPFNGAQAADGPGAGNRTPTEQVDATAAHKDIKVPVENARHITERGVRDGALGASRGSNVILVLGNDKQLFLRAYEAAQLAVQHGIEVEGIIVGPKDSHASVELYTGNHRL